ncbi:MAG: DUF4388 domain-containing protein [Candidatus Eisenbacteria bacterium]|uniref:DUF4388 domain-containing protein n=1 Tax=Eiseniibacteriota bacterium TaxID=2212470 RepID=A0A849T2H5_UNCEI|nr:DUF4388 domain-containing protein [Candidatus Eisenbacteria bacterium]
MSDTVPASILDGNLAHFHLPEVLQLLRLARATGRLDLDRAGEHASVWVENGQPVFARTSGGAVRLGDLLVHRRSVSREALELLLSIQREQPGRRLGEMLVAAGATTSDEVRAALQDMMRRVVFGLLLWREGHFAFSIGDRTLSPEIRLDLDLERLILEGLRLADESGRADPA